MDGGANARKHQCGRRNAWTLKSAQGTKASKGTLYTSRRPLLHGSGDMDIETLCIQFGQ